MSGFRLRWIASLMILMMLVSACVSQQATKGPEGSTGAPEPQKPVPQREVTVGLPSDPIAIDPQLSDTAITVTVLNHIFDPLVQRDARTMEIIPRLAESWEVVDAKTYVFKLRKGVKFHDGKELTASDVKFTIERMGGVAQPKLDTRLKTSFVDPYVASVDVVDPYTVRFNLKIPYALWLRRMPSFYIIPEHYVKAVGNEEFGKRPIGTGPYKLVEWVKDDRLRLEANEQYWGGVPDIKKVVFKPIPEESTRVAALRSGEIDVASALTPDSIPGLEQDKNVRVATVTGNRFNFFAMNLNVKPFENVKVRQAVSYAIDWDTIVSQIYGKHGTVVPFPALPWDFGYKVYSGDVMPKVYKYNPDKAKQLLAEAGFPNGFDTVIETPIGQWPKDVEVTQAVAAQLQKVGIRAKVQAAEYATFQQRWSRNAYEGIALYSLGNPLFDPDQWFLIHMDAKRSAIARYTSPYLQDLVERGMSEVDTNKRVAIYRDAMIHVLENAPYAFGWAVSDIYGVRADVEWQPRADYRVYMDEAKLVRR